MKLTRARFEQMTESLVKRTLEPCRQALKDAGLNPSEIDEVILVGGSTRIPSIQDAVEKFFGKKPNRSVNPDEVVAIGAGVQGGVLGGNVSGVLLLDVTPLSMGIETMGNMYDIVIEANSTIPIKKSKTYSTASENQPQVEIHILQGERPMARDNRTVGRFILDGIPPAPRGVPQIEVIFDMDANGILSVTALDKGTGKQQNVRIEASTGLSKDEIARMKAEAEANAETDRQARERAEKLNAADSLIFQTEKQLREYGEKVPANHKENIEKGLTELREAHKVQDLARIDTATEQLTQAWSAASQDIYQATQGAEGAGGDAGFAGGQEQKQSSGGGTQAQDVEFEEVK
jgi:molecular chaperone DnaK